MDVKAAIAIAKDYLKDVYADEQLSNIGLEETEYNEATKRWSITLGFSRPWNTPRTRAQEVLESMGAVTSLRRTLKIVTIGQDGAVVSMKNPSPAEAA